VQSSAARWVPLRVPEIRRLFWRLVLATKQTIGHILEWSAWRRWHQGMAQFESMEKLGIIDALR
jgi:hypothetical protein